MKAHSILGVSTLAIAIILFPGALTAQSQQASSQQPEQADRSSLPRKIKVKRGSRDDIAAIGARKIDGLDWYSQEKEIEIGKQAAQEIEGRLKFVEDPAVTEYVNRIGQELVRNSDVKVPFVIKVVNSDEAGTFALPGGFLYVNSGLLRAADNEAELAGVMAHAIAHVAARHLTRLLTRSQFAGYTELPLIFFPVVLDANCISTSQCGQNIGLPVTMLKFQRAFELEADYFGVQYLYKAGYEPNAFATFLEKRAQQEKPNARPVALAFADHPPLAERVQNARKEIAAILPARDHSTLDTPEFQQVKARVQSLHTEGETPNPH